MAEAEGVESDADELRKLVRRIIESGATRFNDRASRSRVARSLVASETAMCLESTLNAEAESMPQDSLEDKRKLASWLNHELRQLGLAIRCEPSGIPGILVAMPGRANRDESSRFRIEARDVEGNKVRSPSLGWVPKLKLVEDAVRREGRSRFRS